MKQNLKSLLAAFALAFVLTGVALFAGVQIWRITHDTDAAADAYGGIAEQAGIEGDSSAAEQAAAGPLARQFDWAALQAQYPGLVGWLASPDTEMDYPIMQAEDNDYYLTRLPDGTANKHGSLFLDADNAANFSAWHSFVYGHNMKDGSMFHSLKGYEEQSYADAHPALYLYTPGRTYTLEVFSAYVTASNDTVAYQQRADNAGRTQWLDAVARRSAVTTSAAPQAQETFVTLSTCTNNGSEERFVVHTVARYGPCWPAQAKCLEKAEKLYEEDL